MDIRNIETLGTIDNTPIVQLNNFYMRSSNRVYEAKVFVDEPQQELTEANYCPLPEYCRVEDKHLYLAGILK